MSNNDSQPETGKQPVFLMPNAVTAMIGILVAIHAAQTFILDQEGQLMLSVWFGFIPLRLTLLGEIPGGMLPLLWTPITHAFLHVGWQHVLLNAAWLAVFGTPIARRYGAIPFVVIFGLGAIAGALAYALVNTGDFHILVGASGGIAGLTGAAIRFMFQPVQVARHPETGETIVLGRALASLHEVLSQPRPRSFLLFWVGINAILPLLPYLIGGFEMQIAWQAHLGGFFCGLFIVPLFERRANVAATNR